MGGKAFNQIVEGLHEALAYARSEATDLHTDRDEDLHAIERNALLGAPTTDYTTGKTMADLVDGVKPLRTKLTEVALRSSKR